MPDLRPLNSISELSPGDTIRHIDGGADHVVTSVSAYKAIATPFVEVTTPSMWLHLPAGPSPAQEEPRGEHLWPVEPAPEAPPEEPISPKDEAWAAAMYGPEAVRRAKEVLADAPPEAQQPPPGYKLAPAAEVGEWLHAKHAARQQVGERPEPYGWVIADSAASKHHPPFTRSPGRVEEWRQVDRGVLPLYERPAPRQEASGDGLREAADQVWRRVEHMSRGRSGGYYCTGCSAQPLPGETLVDHEGDCPGRARRAALDAAPPVAAPPGEGEQPFRVERDGDVHLVLAWTGERVWPFPHLGVARSVRDLLNRLFAARPSAAPPPTVSEEVRELVLAAESAETYLLDPERNPRRVLAVAQSLAEARAAVESAPSAFPAERLSEDVRNLVDAAQIATCEMERFRYTHPRIVSTINRIDSALAALERTAAGGEVRDAD